VIWAICAALVAGVSRGTGAALVLIGTPITAFLSMNFTGSSTFTCQPGAALEVRWGLVPMIVSLAAGIALAVAARLASL
jgi:acetyl-CoA decarbonylase/synthase complex subunit gamma